MEYGEHDAILTQHPGTENPVSRSCRFAHARMYLLSRRRDLQSTVSNDNPPLLPQGKRDDEPNR